MKNKGRANDGFMLWQLWKQRSISLRRPGRLPKTVRGNTCAGIYRFKAIATIRSQVYRNYKFLRYSEGVQFMILRNTRTK